MVSAKSRNEQEKTRFQSCFPLTCQSNSIASRRLSRCGSRGVVVGIVLVVAVVVVFAVIVCFGGPKWIDASFDIVHADPIVKNSHA